MKKEYPGIERKMPKTTIPGFWVGALSGLTLAVVSTFYNQWQIDEFNRTQNEKYQQRYKNGLQEFEARIAKCKERITTKP
jgi:hypothetical protein